MSFDFEADEVFAVIGVVVSQIIEIPSATAVPALCAPVGLNAILDEQ